jgi:hypothetical protein
MIDRIIQKMKSSSTTSSLVRTPCVSGRLGRGLADRKDASLSPCAWSRIAALPVPDVSRTVELLGLALPSGFLRLGTRRSSLRCCAVQHLALLSLHGCR